ncbi:alpha-amylase [Fodinicola acaciae]|uniref:alpha-amylase n=1 Tax=Fodinicola acaciae TaxID=2681555 RepID=UPI0013CF55A8|nr:alpha-amylase family protein [Fodinicola acaciae]
MKLPALLLAALLLAPAPAAAAAPAYGGPRAGIVQLFQWPWTDVGRECTNFLGPKGVWAVQVTPPQEHARVSGDPWWEVYQPVSYRLDSRSGSRAQFAAMVNTCKAAGVVVIADVVLNHMTGTDGTSIVGTAYTKYHYPSYGPQDFHQPTCQVSNYQDRANVQNCELVELADLNTGADYVRQTEAGYLNDLLSLGVGGFRIDAAKHMAAGDLAAILSRVTKPYVYSEVIDYGGEAVSRDEYTGIGNVTEFKYGKNITSVFRSGTLASLMHPEQSWNNWGLLGSSDAVPFVDDHDTERDGSALNYKDGSLYNLAQVFTLAWPYGNPLVTSDFNWSGKDDAPPTAANGMTIGPYAAGDTTYPSGCTNIRPWVCDHRWGNIANMFGFRAATTGAWSVDNKWDNGYQQIAFSRGNLGFVAINRESFGMDQTLQTGLAAGTYCDVLSGDFDLASRACGGRTISVAADGTAHLTLTGMTAAAIYTGSKLRARW